MMFLFIIYPCNFIGYRWIIIITRVKKNAVKHTKSTTVDKKDRKWLPTSSLACYSRYPQTNSFSSRSQKIYQP